MVFEAAARHGSFTLAAEELNVQQPAVSASVRQLEASLGVQLFARQHKRVELTAAGMRFYEDVARAFEQIFASAQSIRQRTRGDYVTLSASSAFTYYWMMPRLAGLHEHDPDIDLRLQSSDREPDIDTENISLAIRRGRGTWPGCHAAKVADEAISVVASPGLMRQAGALAEPRDLLRQRLIHLEEPIRERPTWVQWFAHFGVRTDASLAGLRLNDYALVIQAAIAGEGFAFGWRHITDPLVEQGLLAARSDWVWETGYGFYLVWSKERALTGNADRVREWILSHAAREESAP